MNVPYLHDSLTVEVCWLIIGFVGQCLYLLRFVVQWLASKKAQRSVIPMSFWYLSIGGNSALTLYAVYRQDPVFIFAMMSALFLNVQNWVYIIRHHERD